MAVTKLKEIPSEITPKSNREGLIPENIEFVPKNSPVRVSFIGTDCVSVAKALEKTFGSFPLQLSRYEHEQSVLAMHAATGFQVYQELLVGLRTYGEIEVRIS